MAEYIKRDAVLDICEDAREEGFGDIRGVMFRVRLLNAADVVEVVRCKDCEAWQENQWSKGEMVCKCWGDWLPTEPDDFCSYGKRRTDE